MQPIIKNLVLLIFLLLASQLALHAQTVVESTRPAHDANGNPLPGGGIMTFEEEVHDFGELQEGSDASWTFKFTNTGTEAILIARCNTSGGSWMVKSWPHDPISPGESGEISGKYDSHHSGGFYKYVMIISNAAQVDKLIYVKGAILPRPSHEHDGAGNPVIIGK